MPKPREIARNQRQLGRHIATRDALTAISTISPSIPLLPEAQRGYDEQARRIAQWFSRAHRLSAALAESGQNSGQRETD
jgi:hypothetical protein